MPGIRQRIHLLHHRRCPGRAVPAQPQQQRARCGRSRGRRQRRGHARAGYWAAGPRGPARPGRGARRPGRADSRRPSPPCASARQSH